MRVEETALNGNKVAPASSSVRRLNRHSPRAAFHIASEKAIIAIKS